MANTVSEDYVIRMVHIVVPRLERNEIISLTMPARRILHNHPGESSYPRLISLASPSSLLLLLASTASCYVAHNGQPVVLGHGT